MARQYSIVLGRYVLFVDRHDPPILYGVQPRWNGSTLQGTQVIGLQVTVVILTREMRAVGLVVGKVHNIIHYDLSLPTSIKILFTDSSSRRH